MFFFFNDTATTEIYTLSLHDALPISSRHLSAQRLGWLVSNPDLGQEAAGVKLREHAGVDRVRLDLGMRYDPNLFGVRSEEHTSDSSHANISYAVFCLKKRTPGGRRPV